MEANRATTVAICVVSLIKKMASDRIVHAASFNLRKLISWMQRYRQLYIFLFTIFVSYLK